MHNAPHDNGGVPNTAGDNTDSFPSHNYAPSAGKFLRIGKHLVKIKHKSITKK